MKPRLQGWWAFISRELLIMLLLVILLAAVVLPNFLKPRTIAAKNACIANLKQLDGAKAQWALENKQADGVLPPPGVVLPYLKNSALPVCPNGGRYTLNAIGSDPTCSIGGEGHQLTLCRNHLFAIREAKRRWAMQDGKRQGDQPAESELLPFLGGQWMPKCPNGGAYNIGAIGQHPTCSKSGALHQLPANLM